MTAPTRDQRGAMVGRHAVAEPYVGLNYDTPSASECLCRRTRKSLTCPQHSPASYALVGSMHRAPGAVA